MDTIRRLQARMAAAAEAGDHETAALLREAIDRLASGRSQLREQVPGRMGLGTSQEDYAGDPPRRRPKRPDTMTANHKPAGGRR